MKTLPTIHTNGTSAAELFRGYRAAMKACQSATEAIRGIEFNARDYYPQGPEAWTSALSEMERHAANIKAAKDAFLAVAMHVQEFIKD